MKRLSIFLILAIGMSIQLVAQTYDADILRYSTQTPMGTARSLGVGGAFSSVGADFSAVAVNPAGIGVYRSTEFVVTPRFTLSSNSTDYLGVNSKESETDFGINNIGIVFSKVRDKEGTGKGFITTNFAFGVNRLNEFNNDIFFEGQNSDNSFSSPYVEDVNQEPSLPVSFDNYDFETVLAYNAWLVNIDTNTGFFTTPVVGTVNQTGRLETSGGMNEVFFTLGTNYANKLYFGGTIGIPYLSYDASYTFTEDDVNTSNGAFVSSRLEREYEANGIGFNAKFGVIYKPIKWFRVGASIHSPNFMAMDETYSSVITADFDTIPPYIEESPVGIFDFDTRLPWRAIAGISFFIKKYGFISGDYEYVDYGKAQVNFGSTFGTQENVVNDLISAKYGPTHNFRVGAEFGIPEVRFRAGYGYQMSPFKEGIAEGDFDFSTQHISGGVGFRVNNIFVDLAYVRSQTKQFLAPYFLNDGAEPGAMITTNKDNVVVTVGYKL